MIVNKDLQIGGISFGLTSGIITTLGMIVGINIATESTLAIVASILTISIADSLSDALGMHLSEESRLDELGKPVWLISFYVFWAKFLTALVFVLPFLIFDKNFAVGISLVFGFLMVFLLSIYVAKRSKKSVLESVFEHIFLALVVIFISYFVGNLAERIV